MRKKAEKQENETADGTKGSDHIRFIIAAARMYRSVCSRRVLVLTVPALAPAESSDHVLDGLERTSVVPAVAVRGSTSRVGRCALGWRGDVIAGAASDGMINE